MGWSLRDHSRHDVSLKRFGALETGVKSGSRVRAGRRSRKRSWGRGDRREVRRGPPRKWSL